VPFALVVKERIEYFIKNIFFYPGAIILDCQFDKFTFNFSCYPDNAFFG